MVGFHRTRLGDNHTTTNLVLINTAEQQTDIVASFTFVKNLTEHLNTGNSALQLLSTHTNNINGVASVDNTSLNTASRDSTTTRDREHVLNRHQEIFIFLADRFRYPIIDSVHEFLNGLDTFGLTIQSGKSGTTNNGDIVAIKIIGAKEFSNLHFNEIKQLGVIDKVALVQEHNQLRNTHLASEQNVLTSLRHRTICGSYNKNCTIHLSSTSNHVLHIVSVTRTIHMRIVTLFGLILNVSSVDGNTTLFLLRGGVNRIEAFHFGKTLFSKHFCNTCSEGCFTMVNMANSTNVDVRLRTIKFFFCHF